MSDLNPFGDLDELTLDPQIQRALNKMFSLVANLRLYMRHHSTAVLSRTR